MPDSLDGCLVLEKLDGTMCNLWWDRTDFDWKVSTRSMVYADGPVGNLTSKTFADLFSYACMYTATGLCHMMVHDLLKHDHCYTFELTSPENIIVTPYKDYRITLLTARNLNTLDELSRIAINCIARDFECAVPKAFSVDNWKRLLEMEGLASTDEGFVVVRESKEGSHKRVKVKNLAYLAISKIVSRVSEEAFIDLIQCEKQDDFLAYKPEYKEHMQRLLDGIKEVERIIRLDWLELQKYKEQNDRKSFAIEAVKRKFPSVLFEMYDGKITNLGNDLLLKRSDYLLRMIHATVK